MALPILLPLISLATTAWQGWVKMKEIKTKGKQVITQAKLEAKVRKIDSLYSMDAAAAGDMRYSFKDEYLMVLISVPIVMSFIPKLAPYVAQGFEVLGTTPDWYRWSFLGIIAATFGLRAWFTNKIGG